MVLLLHLDMVNYSLELPPRNSLNKKALANYT